MSGLLLNLYHVSVSPYPGVIAYPAKSVGQAKAKAWRDVTVAEDVSFKDFMSRCSAKLAPEAFKGDFGAPITVCGKPAFFVGHSGRNVRFVRPGSEVVLTSHPLDVEGAPE